MKTEPTVISEKILEEKLWNRVRELLLEHIGADHDHPITAVMTADFVCKGVELDGMSPPETKRLVVILLKDLSAGMLADKYEPWEKIQSMVVNSLLDEGRLINDLSDDSSLN